MKKTLKMVMMVLMVMVAVTAVRAETILLQDDFNRPDDWNLDSTNTRWHKTAGNTINLENTMFCRDGEEALSVPTFDVTAGAVTVSYDFAARLTGWEGGMVRLYNNDKSEYLQVLSYYSAEGLDCISLKRFDNTGTVLQSYTEAYYGAGSTLPWHVTLTVDATKIVSFGIDAGGSPAWTNPLVTDVTSNFGGSLSAVQLGMTTTHGGGSYNWIKLDNVLVTQVPEPMTMVLLGVGGLILRRRMA